jgi:hypothetical protein
VSEAKESPAIADSPAPSHQCIASHGNRKFSQVSGQWCSAAAVTHNSGRQRSEGKASIESDWRQTAVMMQASGKPLSGCANAVEITSLSNSEPVGDLWNWRAERRRRTRPKGAEPVDGHLCRITWRGWQGAVDRSGNGISLLVVESQVLRVCLLMSRVGFGDFSGWWSSFGVGILLRKDVPGCCQVEIRVAVGKVNDWVEAILASENRT